VVCHALNPPSESLEREIKRTFRYFDFFDHALTVQEVWRYLGTSASEQQVVDALRHMNQAGTLALDAGYYALRASNTHKRIHCQELNERRLRLAHRVGRFIQHFPFVAGVYLSGSLSKSGMQSTEEDLDFFILTAPKIVLFNSEKYFCINMLMDESALVVNKRNIYTATEIASLVPLTHPEKGAQFLKANDWVWQYFPNLPSIDPPPVSPTRFGAMERLLHLFGGPRLERWCRKRFSEHMRRKVNPGTGEFQAEEHLSAYFPKSVENRLLAFYNTENE
jgi:hypothetical protein